MSLSPDERLIARYAHPNESPDEEVEIRDSTPFIERNKLSAALAANVSDRFDELDDRTLRRRSLRELEALRDELEARDIAFAVIKSLPIVPKPVGDIDLLVEDLEISEAILARESYSVASRERHKVVYERHFEDCRVAFHLHASVAWEGITYLETDDILQARTSRATDAVEVPVPSPHDELLITAAHMLFERGNMRINVLNVIEYRLHFEWNDIDLDRLLSVADRFCWRRGLARYLTSVDTIYQELYGRPVAPEIRRELDTTRTPNYSPFFKSWPLTLPAVIAVRLEKLRCHVKREGVAAAGSYGSVYAGDLVAIMTERYGVTYSHRRLRHFLTGE